MCWKIVHSKALIFKLKIVDREIFLRQDYNCVELSAFQHTLDLFIIIIQSQLTVKSRLSVAGRYFYFFTLYSLIFNIVLGQILRHACIYPCDFPMILHRFNHDPRIQVYFYVLSSTDAQISSSVALTISLRSCLPLAMNQLQSATFDYITIKMQSEPIVPDIGDNREEENILVVRRDTLKKSEQLEVYEYQVSGKTPKYIDNIHGVIYKLFSQNEYEFYQFVRSIKEPDQRSGMKAFLPQYMGIVNETELDGMQTLKKELNASDPNLEQSERTHRNLWIDHIASRQTGQTNKPNYLCLKNLTFNYQSPNILDLKLGKKKPKKSNAKFQASTTNSHGFRINGMVVQLHNGIQFQQCFVSKYFGQKVTVDEIENYLALFFFDGKKINRNLLESVLSELNVLISSFKKFTGIKFISSSLFISFDAVDPSKYCLKLIDFDKYQRDQQVKQDTNISMGLQSIATYLNNISKAIEQHQQLLVNKELKIFGEDIVIVPQHKMAEYKFKKAQEEQNCS